METISGKYKYSVLKYSYSPFLEENINVGFIVYFQSENRIVFNYTDNLPRLSSLYPDVNINLLKAYFKEIQFLVKKLDKHLTLFDYNIEDDFNSFINENILSIDGSALEFKQAKTCFRNGLQCNEILRYLSNTFLFNKKIQNKHEINSLKNKFYHAVKTFVRENNNSNHPNFFTNYKIENEIGTEFNFDFAWQNGNLNLVKELDFNSSSRVITKKSYENFGLLFDLKDIATENHYKFDFLVSEPKDKNVFKEYEHSLELFNNFSFARIIEENKLNWYVDKVKENIS